MSHSTNATLILGAGFTGLFTALHLSQRGYNHPVVLIDQRERFTFQPLLYELLSEEMRADQVWPRYEELLSGSGISFVQAKVRAIDLQQRQVQLTSGDSYAYSHLVLALGSIPNYFGVAGAQQYTFPFRTGREAQALAQHLRRCLQKARQIQNPQERRPLLTAALVGAGPAGIELAATLADLLPLWYEHMGGNPQEIRVLLLNRSSKILQDEINNHVRQIAAPALQHRAVPVELCFRCEVTAVGPGWVQYSHEGQEHALETETVLWTAGITANSLVKALPISQERYDRFGRVKVQPTLQLHEFPEVFAGGDCAANEQGPLPPLAQVAYQQGAAIAHNLKVMAEGREPRPVEVHLRGSLVKLGLGESAANLFNRFEVTGKLGHLIRQATYLELLPTPIHNFKATTEWLVDEVFQHNSQSLTAVTSTTAEAKN